jgi:hypothetical protein
VPVLLDTPSALHSRVLHAVVAPPCSTAAERKHSVGEEGEGGGLRAREGGRGQGGRGDRDGVSGRVTSGAKREAARGTHFVHKRLPL